MFQNSFLYFRISDSGLVLVWLAFINCNLVLSTFAISIAVGLLAFNVPGSLVSHNLIAENWFGLYLLNRLARNDGPGAQLHGDPGLVPEHVWKLHRVPLASRHLGHSGTWYSMLMNQDQ